MPLTHRSPRKHRRISAKRKLNFSRRSLVMALLAVSLTTPALFAATERAPAAQQTQSLLPDDLRPRALGDSRPWEVGLKFQVTRPAYAEAIQVYRNHTLSAGTIATLWSSTGRALSSVTFEPSRQTGLDTVQLDSPVQLEPGDDYIVSYSAPQGRQPQDQRQFTRPVSNGVLKAAPDAGVYSGRLGNFPTRTYRSSNYHVDVVVSTGGNGPSTPPPTTSPTSGPTTAPTSEPTTAPTTEPTGGPTTEPTSQPTTTSPTTSPTTAPTTPPTSAPGGANFPTRASTGTPSGWSPRTTVNGDYNVTTAGAVVQDLRIVNGNLNIRANNVTVRRVEVSSGQINNVFSRQCSNGLVIEDTTILRGGTDIGQPAIQFGGYTARRVKIDGPSEGLRVGGKDYGCGEVRVEDTFVNVNAFAGCERSGSGIDWHGDALQGYNGPKVTVRNSVLKLNPTPYCIGNSAFFYPTQGNTSADIDKVLVSGGGFVFRLDTPGTVRNLKVVDDSWYYGPSHNQSCSGGITWGSGNEYVSYNEGTGAWSSKRPLSCLGFRG